MFETCLEHVLGVAWRQPRIKWSRNRHGARHFVFHHLFYTYTLTLSHDCLLPHALIQSFARMLLALVHSLAFFLLPRLIRSLTCFLSSSLPPFLPHSLTRSFACFLPRSFPLIARLILTFHSHSLTHLLTHTFLPLHFLTNITLAHSRFIRLLCSSFIQFFSLFRLLLFSFTHSLVCFFLHSLPRSVVWPSSLSLAFFHLLYFTHSLPYSLKTCSFTGLLTHSFAFLLYAYLLVLSCASSFTELLFAHSLAFFPPYSLTCSIACFLPPLLLTHWPVHLLAASLPSSLVPSFTSSLTYLFACLLVPCLHPSLVTTLVCSVVSSFPHSFIHALVRSLVLFLTHSLTHLPFFSFPPIHLLARPLHFAFTHSLACLHVLSLTRALPCFFPFLLHSLIRSLAQELTRLLAFFFH